MDVASMSGSGTDDCSDLPALPMQIWSREGTAVETHTQVWHITGPAERGTKRRLDWSRFDRVGNFPLLTARARALLKLYLADQIAKKKAGTISRYYDSFLHFARWLTEQAVDLVRVGSRGFNWSDVTEGLARAFLEWGMKHTAEKGNNFCCFRAFYEWGVVRGYGDFRQETLRILQSIKVIGNAKGHHVRFRHPTKGPFSPDELFAIRKALEAKQGTDQDRAIVMLHLELGLNPYASIQLTNADLVCYETEYLTTYQITVPRIKKRTLRRETKRRPVSHTLGELLERLQRGNTEDPLFYWLPVGSPEYALTRAMRRFVKATNIVSPRTNALLCMTPRRFRTSLATYMAAQGASKFHIAEILDHTDLQQVGVYTQTISSIADQVAGATDPILGPLVRRFLGKIADPSEIVAHEAPGPRSIPALAPHLPLPLLNVGGIGSCRRDTQKEGLCRLLPPLSCYLCPSFTAFRTGPHQEMLDSLLSLLELGEDMGDERIKRQLDEVCTAIREVLAQLEPPLPQRSSGAKSRRHDA